MLKDIKKGWNIFFTSNSRLYKSLIIFSIMVSIILLIIVSSNSGKELKPYTTFSLTLFSFTVTTGIGNIYEFLSIHYLFDELQDKNEKRKLVFVGSLQNIILISDFLYLLFIPTNVLIQILFIIFLFFVVYCIFMWINRDEKIHKINKDTLNIKSEIEDTIAKHQINDDYLINTYQNKKNIVANIQNDNINININFKKTK
ncbi:hypothetical protein K4Q40_04015 [Staphylococcus epidermidis]|nr:hypothetical protein [Staphylococcus epidermidis]